MDLGFGGPVWHASIKTYGGQRPEVARRLALRALDGVGDLSLGQWEETIGSAHHIRRRLSYAEQLKYGWVIRDVRGTEEGLLRVRDVIETLPNFPALRALAFAELTDKETQR